MANEFLLHTTSGCHLLHKSKLVSPWSWIEELCWMQLVSRVFPEQSYRTALASTRLETAPGALEP
eukprot:2265002-Rhodomonas_salina.1